MPDDEDIQAEYASPACLLHEIDPVYAGLAPPTPPEGVSAWRKARREALIAKRLALSADTRSAHSQAIADALDDLLGDIAGKTVSLYWPFRGEPDLRGWMETATARDATCLLPIVVAKGQPLIFKSWKQGEKLDRGIWNIPIPAEGKEMLPDIVISPLVGFDPSRYRLGYGGGFFDRTLAAHPGKPLVVGVGYSSQHIPTIHPQWHDIPMQAIITERGLWR
ncbi:5-formyltetrahydrofolate cyclo-ligase [Rhizobium sp. LjRoot254]|uniref:5-formyltetrahydrofolate cyclo-ligase n=1 Tax=Rhizobium sp. LjRoot254 TaxID=3342297 RepID=UPI003ECF5289